jgi:hypothetical protein
MMVGGYESSISHVPDIQAQLGLEAWQPPIPLVFWLPHNFTGSHVPRLSSCDKKYRYPRFASVAIFSFLSQVIASGVITQCYAWGGCYLVNFHQAHFWAKHDTLSEERRSLVS